MSAPAGPPSPTTAFHILQQRPIPRPPPPEQLPSTCGPIPQPPETLDASAWHHFEQEFDAIIAAASPTAATNLYRSEVYRWVAAVLKTLHVCVEVCPFGSTPQETYLPDGDIDICAFFTCDVSVAPPPHPVSLA